MTMDEPARLAMEIQEGVGSGNFGRAAIESRIRAYGDRCRRAGAEAAQEAAARVLENGSFLHDKSPSAIWAKQVAALIRALPIPSAAEATEGNPHD